MSTIKSSAEDLTLNADGSGNDVIIQSNGSTKAIVTAEGNVGIGITPDAWNSSLQAIQVGDYGSINEDTGSKTFDIRSNSYQSASADVYTNTDEATMLRMGGGTYKFYQAVSGSADATVTWTEPLRIDTTGDIQVKTGDIVFGTAGKGICLGVTTNTDSNTLDDYEVGTWTAAITCGSSGSMTLSGSHNVLAYVKVGGLVYIGGRLKLDSISSPSGEISITGLPFSGGHSGGQDSAKSYIGVHIRNAASDVGSVSGQVSASTFMIYESGTTGNTNVDDKIDAGSYIMIGGTYRSDV